MLHGFVGRLCIQWTVSDVMGRSSTSVPGSRVQVLACRVKLTIHAFLFIYINVSKVSKCDSEKRMNVHLVHRRSKLCIALFKYACMCSVLHRHGQTSHVWNGG